MVKIIFFTALVVFPFGQLFKIGFINLFDIAIVLLAMVTLLRKPVYPSWYKYFLYFILSCVFGLLINSSLFTVYGSLYLLRLVSYSFVAIYVSNFQKNKLITNHQSLITIAVTAAIFGWLQYIFWPDLTALKYLGWDDHLLRMVGTFLDPTFLGLILVLGAIIALQYKYNLAFFFLAFSVLFTYSRSSYLALAAVFIIDFIKTRGFKKFVICNLLFVILFLVPKNIGEGTNLARTVSGSNKLINYEESIQIIKKSPVFGVGFNNICSARQKYLNDINRTSHSCNGADSSILFLLATTGIVGLILLLYAVSHMPYGIELKASFVAVLVHSVFSNSLFYPHIMFWLFTLVGLQTKTDSQRS